jgi:hypothetical protein
VNKAPSRVLVTARPARDEGRAEPEAQDAEAREAQRAGARIV